MRPLFSFPFSGASRAFSSPDYTFSFCRERLHGDKASFPAGARREQRAPDFFP